MIKHIFKKYSGRFRKHYEIFCYYFRGFSISYAIYNYFVPMNKADLYMIPYTAGIGMVTLYIVFSKLGEKGKLKKSSNKKFED